MENLTVNKVVVNKAVNNKAINKANNKAKLESKSINLLNVVKKEAKKETKLETVKNKTKNKASFSNCVIETNRLMNMECDTLGFAMKKFIECKNITLTNRPLSDKFTIYDKIKMTAVYEIIELAKKDSKLYKFIETIEGIKTKKGRFVAYFLGTKLFKEQRETMLTKYVNSNMQEREIFTFE